MGEIQSASRKHMTIDELTVHFEKEHQAHLDNNASMHDTVIATYKLFIILKHSDKQLHKEHTQRFEFEVTVHTHKKAHEHSNGWGPYVKGAIKLICIGLKAKGYETMATNTPYDVCIYGVDMQDKLNDNNKQENLTHTDHHKSTNETRRHEHSAEQKNIGDLVQKSFNDMDQHSNKKGNTFSMFLKG